MRIYSMTATFGKLEHETLTLQPGLNIIQAPNEWGKSTWCAFLVAMLYGMETRTHTTKTALADKERYAPWSGSPMSGRIDLDWEGRKITIERRTKGRAILGDFRAYETETGTAILELTAANCGQTLLGVERSVFTRAGFLRLSDLPVTQDESLRRRLNALVTTGDESGAGDALAQKLKDLKNRCRFNRSGLLPQTEAQRADLQSRLRELEGLGQQVKSIQTRQAELEKDLAQLENHQAALAYAAAHADGARVSEAEAAQEEAARRLAALEETCQALPSQAQTEQVLRESTALQQDLVSLQGEAQELPPPPQMPVPPAPFQGMSGQDAIAMARKDGDAYAALTRGKWLPFLLVSFLLAFVGLGALLLRPEIWPLALLFLGLAAGIFALRLAFLQKQARKAQVYVSKYGSADQALWLSLAERYAKSQREYAAALETYQSAQADLSRRTAALNQKINALCQGRPLQLCQEDWRQILSHYAKYQEAQREYRRCAGNAQAIKAMAKSAPPPQFPDDRTESPEETSRLLADGAYKQRQLHLKLGQCLGQMEKLGQEEALRRQLETVNGRIAQLEDTYAALTIAQQTLADAAAELQRRFAPRISQRTQALFGKLTGNRYDRLALDQDLIPHAGAQGEDTLRTSLWRSDGTVDQLYFSLRLAVAEALTPNAPLILDDALARFDDTRLAAAMEILRQEAEAKQVILFTCQSREQNA